MLGQLVGVDDVAAGLDILSIPKLNQGWPNTLSGRGISRAIRKMGQ
jgi:hypothetical protein